MGFSSIIQRLSAAFASTGIVADPHSTTRFAYSWASPKRLLQDVHRHRPQPADLGARRRDLAALAGEIEGSAGPPPVPPLFQREGVDERRGADAPLSA